MLLHKHLKQEARTGTASSEHSIFIKNRMKIGTLVLFTQGTRLALWILLMFLAMNFASPTSRILTPDELQELEANGWKDNGTHVDYSLDKSK